MGEIENGRELYLKAFQNAKKANYDYLKNMAILHLAKEEINAKTDNIENIFTQVQKETNGSQDNDVLELFKLVADSYKKNRKAD